MVELKTIDLPDGETLDVARLTIDVMPELHARVEEIAGNLKMSVNEAWVHAGRIFAVFMDPNLSFHDFLRSIPELEDTLEALGAEVSEKEAEATEVAEEVTA